jgi:hypothetical protein
VLLQDCCARILELVLLSAALCRRRSNALLYLLVCPLAVCSLMFLSSLAIGLTKVRLIRKSKYSSAVSIYLKMRMYTTLTSGSSSSL